MPRMSKSRKLEWSFFLNDRGRITFNALCRKCIHDCKQSFRAIVIECPRYRSKRAKAERAASLPRGPKNGIERIREGRVADSCPSGLEPGKSPVSASAG